MVKYKSITSISKVLLLVSLLFSSVTIFFAFYHHRTSIIHSQLNTLGDELFFNCKKLSEVVNKVVSGGIESFDDIELSLLITKDSYKKLSNGNSGEFSVPENISKDFEIFANSLIVTEKYINGIIKNKPLLLIANNKKNSLSTTFQELVFVSEKAVLALKKNKGSKNQVLAAQKLQFYFQSLYTLILQSYNTNVDPKEISNDFMLHSQSVDEIFNGLLVGRSPLNIKKVKSKSVRGIFKVLQDSYQAAQATLLIRLSGAYEVNAYDINLERNFSVMSGLLDASYKLTDKLNDLSSSMLVNPVTLGVSFAVSILFFISTLVSFFYDARIKFANYFKDSSVIVEDSKKINSEVNLLIEEVSSLINNDLDIEASVRANAITVSVARAINHAVKELSSLVCNVQKSNITIDKSILGMSKLNKSIDMLSVDQKKSAEIAKQKSEVIKSKFHQSLNNLKDLNSSLAGVVDLIEATNSNEEIIQLIKKIALEVSGLTTELEQEATSENNSFISLESDLKNIIENSLKTKIAINKISQHLVKVDSVGKKLVDGVADYKVPDA